MDAVPWAAYRAAAMRLLARASTAPVVVGRASPLRAGAVRWPGGTVSRPAPGWLVAGLAQGPATPEGAAARQALRAIAAAPSQPAAGPPTGRLDRALAAALREPAFAANRQGPDTFLRRVAARVWLALSRRLVALWGRPFAAGAARVLGLVLALFALLGLGRVVLLVSGGWEGADRSLRRRQRRPSGPAPLDEASAALAGGDVAGSARATLAAALGAIGERYGLQPRPGWTGRRVYAQLRAQLDADWPRFGELVAFHDRMLFGPAGPGRGSRGPDGAGLGAAGSSGSPAPGEPFAGPYPAAAAAAPPPDEGAGGGTAGQAQRTEAARWIGEVRRWTGAR